VSDGGKIIQVQGSRGNEDKLLIEIIPVVGLFREGKSRGGGRDTRTAVWMREGKFRARRGVW
jgi:hypothetical protein